MEIGYDILCVTATLNLGIAAYILSMIYFLIMFYLSVKVDQRARVDKGHFGLIFKIIRIMSHDTKELSSLKNENNF